MDILGTLTVAIVVLSCIIFVLVIVLTVLGPTQYNPYRPSLIKEQAQPDSEEYTTLKNEGKDAYGRFGESRDTTKKLGSEVSVQVVVLGDIGHSPRMQYHAHSLTLNGATVQLIGYQESDIVPHLAESPLLKLVPLQPPPSFLRGGSIPFVVRGPLKALHQAWDLYHALAFRTEATKFMLVQNPPAIPLLAVAYLVCLQRNTRLVIDWHNYGWSILALKLGQNHPLVLISRLYEHLFARGAHAHFTVTDAMAQDMAKLLSSSPKALHDRPAPAFQPISSQMARSKALASLEPTAQFSRELDKGTWKLLVSSTSWTADEDFSILLSALVDYSTRKVNEPKLPKLLVVITGKGPQKKQYLREIARLNQDKKLENVVIQTAWLSFADYALLLASADLGVCLHQSSSGLDLPMKVVDMFGAGLPVVAWSKYPSFQELVKDGKNGEGFGSAAELLQLLITLLAAGNPQLEVLRQGALEESRRRWDEEWNGVAAPVFSIKPAAI